MEEILKKVLILVLIVVVTFGFGARSFAVLEVGQRNVFPKADCERLLTFNGTPIRTTYVAYIKDGVEYPAYCLDANVDGVGERGEYSVNGVDKLRDINVWRAIINGYPYKSLEELGAVNGQEAFTATKQAVYTMIYNRDISSYGPVDSDSGRRTYQIYCNIVNAARNSSEVIVDNVYTTLHAVTDEWQKDQDEKILYKEYFVESNISSGNYVISLTGKVPAGTKVISSGSEVKNEFKMNEFFKVVIPMSSCLEEGTFTINANAKLDTKPVMYGATSIPGTQDYALTGFMYEEIGSSREENYLKNTTKISVLKKDEESGEALENVKFDFLNSDEEKLFTDLITDNDGKIVIESILPGKYYIKETQTIEGYEMNTEVYEIEISYGEKKEIVITNKKIVPPEPEPEPELEPEPEPEPEPKPEHEPTPEPEIKVSSPEPEKQKEIISEPVEAPEIIPEEVKILPRTGF